MVAPERLRCNYPCSAGIVYHALDKSMEPALSSKCPVGFSANYFVWIFAPYVMRGISLYLTIYCQIKLNSALHYGLKPLRIIIQNINPILSECANSIFLHWVL